MSDTSNAGRVPGSLPDDLAAAAAAKVDQGLHAAGLDATDRDPHGKTADYTLRPDPDGRRDPIGRPDADPHAHAAAGGPDVADRAAGLADDVRERLGGVADEARTWVAGVQREQMRRIDDVVVRGNDGLQRGRTAVEQFVTENPLLVGVVGVAAGLLLGALLPRTRQEDRNIGPYADEVRDQGLRYAREFTSRGREFVETALDPDNIQAAAEKAAASEPNHRGDDRTAHRL